MNRSNASRWHISKIFGRALFLGGLLLGSAAVHAACPAGEIEALLGNGASTKIGYSPSACATGCNRRVYRTMGATTSTKCESEIFSRNSSPHESKVNHETLTITSDAGSSFTYNTKVNPFNCSASSTLSGTADQVDVISWQKRVWNYTDMKWENDSCQQTTVLKNGMTTVTGSCDHQCPDKTGSGYTLISTTSTTVCGVTTTVAKYRLALFDANGNLSTWGTLTLTTYSGSTYRNEYTTKQIIAEARGCAEASLGAQSFDNCGGCGRSAVASFNLNGDVTTATCQAAKWRIKVTGTTAKDKLKITLFWITTVNGKSTPSQETRSAAGSDQPVWYFPSIKGEPIEIKTSEACTYSWAKQLTGVKIELAEQE